MPLEFVPKAVADHDHDFGANVKDRMKTFYLILWNPFVVDIEFQTTVTNLQTLKFCYIYFWSCVFFFHGIFNNKQAFNMINF